ncbi:hypothetical protein C7M84_023875 [Penaeus vannamei]|uniref:Uncharacterized protein n=1 Tax=Penaeus vannamei TaxID=6689 RepID=A0A423U2L2_PENVA|nr:hypothetical protein C7M84_023875 [Penaeus vannamei]
MLSQRRHKEPSNLPRASHPWQPRDILGYPALRWEDIEVPRSISPPISALISDGGWRCGGARRGPSHGSRRRRMSGTPFEIRHYFRGICYIIMLPSCRRASPGLRFTPGEGHQHPGRRGKLQILVTARRLRQRSWWLCSLFFSSASLSPSSLPTTSASSSDRPARLLHSHPFILLEAALNRRNTTFFLRTLPFPRDDHPAASIIIQGSNSSSPPIEGHDPSRSFRRGRYRFTKEDSPRSHKATEGFISLPGNVTRPRPFYVPSRPAGTLWVRKLWRLSGDLSSFPHFPLAHFSNHESVSPAAPCACGEARDSGNLCKAGGGAPLPSPTPRACFRDFCIISLGPIASVVDSAESLDGVPPDSCFLFLAHYVLILALRHMQALRTYALHPRRPFWTVTKDIPSPLPHLLRPPRRSPPRHDPGVEDRVTVAFLVLTHCLSCDTVSLHDNHLPMLSLPSHLPRLMQAEFPPLHPYPPTLLHSSRHPHTPPPCSGLTSPPPRLQFRPT